MKWVTRIIIVAVSLAEGVAWTQFTSSLWQLGNAVGGSGDGAGGQDDSGGMLATLIIAIVWLFLASPYLCMVAGSVI